MKLIGEIRARGYTILLIEHHMDIVMASSDHVAVLDHGVKIAEGTAAQKSAVLIPRDTALTLKGRALNVVPAAAVAVPPVVVLDDAPVGSAVGENTVWIV